MRAGVVAALVAAMACGARPAPVAPAGGEIEWRAMDPGRSCVEARVACAPGNCAARLRNGCEEPVTCELDIQCACEAFTGERGEARSQASTTLASGEGGGMRAHALCAAGEVRATQPTRLRCQ
jgi:hypothetical protein